MLDDASKEYNVQRMIGFRFKLMFAAVFLTATVRAIEMSVSPGEDLVKVRDSIREGRASGKIGAAENVVVSLAPGEYFLPEALVFDERDSGSADYAPVIWRAVKPHQTRLLGGLRLKAADFSVCTDEAVLSKVPPEARGRIQVADLSARIPGKIADLPEDHYIGARAPLLCVRGTFAPLARWPNNGDWAVFKTKVDSLAFVFDSERPTRWDFKKGVWLGGYWSHDWRYFNVKAKSFGSENGTNHVLRIAKDFPYGIMKGHTISHHKGRRFFAYNLLEELDAPNEWYFDRVSKKLYFIPAGEKVEDADELVLALNDTALVRFESSARHMRFMGIDFGPSANDLVTLTNASEISFADCSYACAGRTAIELDGARNVVRDCMFRMIGGSAVVMSGGDAATLRRADSVVERCRFEKFGQLARTDRGAVVLKNGCGMTVRHCEMFDAPHLAVRFMEGVDNLFEYNDVHHVLLETSDAGAFYTGRSFTSQGNVLRYNHIHDIGQGRKTSSCVAIYFDDGDAGDEVYGNVIRNVGLGILVGGGREHPIRNNIFIDCGRAISMATRLVKWKNAFKAIVDKSCFDRYHTTDGVWAERFPRLANLMDDEPKQPLYNPIEHNIFIDCGNGKSEVVSIDDAVRLERLAPISGNVIVHVSGRPECHTAMGDERIASGFKAFVGSQEKPIDCGFRNAKDGDFGLRPDSMLLKECPGFIPIPFQKIGLR